MTIGQGKQNFINAASAEDELLYIPAGFKLPIGENSARLSQRELEERLRNVRAYAEVKEKAVERMFAEQNVSKKNMGDVDEVVFGRDIDQSNEAVLHAYVRPVWADHLARLNPAQALTEPERRELEALEATLHREKAKTAVVANALHDRLARSWVDQEHKTLLG